MFSGTGLDYLTGILGGNLEVDVANPALTIVCSWCERVVRRGAPLACVTHTICAPCIDRMMSAAAPKWHPPASYFGDFFDPARPRRRES